MRYTHPFKAIRAHSHAVKISFIITFILMILIAILGFTILDAKQFFLGFMASLTRVSVSYLIALVVALLLSLIISFSQSVEELLLPILDVAQSFPSFALYPLMVIWFGKSALVTIFILILEMIWPILFTVLSAQKTLREDLQEAASVFGASGLRYLIFVLFPMLFPAIITGSIVAWGEAWEAVIAAEIIVNVPGVGSYLASSAEGVGHQVLVVGIFLLLALLFIINKYLWLPLLNLSTRYTQE